MRKIDRPWTDGETQALIAARKRGEPYGRIARQLNRTRRSCLGKGFRLGLCAETPHLKGRAGLAKDETEQRRRLKIARAVVDAGGTLRDIATQWPAASDTVRKWLHNHAPEILDKLRRPDHPGRAGKPAAEALERLRKIRDGRAAGLAEYAIAYSLGISPAALSSWLKRWAPDSVEQAIEDLSPEPELEEAA